MRPLANRRETGAIHKYWNCVLSFIASGHCAFLCSLVPCVVMDGNTAPVSHAGSQGGVTGPQCLGIKKQRVVKVVMDVWLATAGLGANKYCRRALVPLRQPPSPPPLPPLAPRVQNFPTVWAALS